MIGIKPWLDNLYYNLGNQQYDFFVSGLKKTVDGTKSTRWRKFSEVVFPLGIDEEYKLSWVNQRQILPNEIVLDLENKSQLKPISKELKKLGINFYVFSTKSRGFHIHIFLDRELNEEQKLSVIKYFGADSQKAGNKTMIALEFAPHWKSNKIKELIEYGG